MNAIRVTTAVAALAAAAALPTTARTTEPAPAPAPVAVAARSVVAPPEAVASVAPVRVATPKPKPRTQARPKRAAQAAAPAVWDGRAFETPEDAMRFLVRAYNSHADRALAHVTTPDARANLVAMRDYAPALRLTSCARIETGAYDCEFTHSVKGSAKWDGYASFRVAPATKPGWYMTVLMDCGDAE